MKRTIIATSILAFTLSAAAPLFAAETNKPPLTPEQACRQQAHHEHIAKSKMRAYIESCVQKHNQATTTPVTK